MRTLPLTVLAHEGPQVRAYLARMRRDGLRASRIVLMVQTHHPATGKPVGRFLPRLMRLAYAEKIQDLAENYWPRRIRREQPELVATMTRELRSISEGAPEIVAEMLGRFRYELYAECVDRVLVDGLSDPALVEALGRSRGAVLFTGGGILRSNLLQLPGIRFLHVHPGNLPHVRGADGLLWSMLVRQRPGVSCFYMASGIDTGQVIAAQDLPVVTFDTSRLETPDNQTLYRALLAFYDPLLRAELLATRVLSAEGQLDALPATTQDESRGLTYHFLHSRLRATALVQVFRS